MPQASMRCALMEYSSVKLLNQSSQTIPAVISSDSSQHNEHHANTWLQIVMDLTAADRLFLKGVFRALTSGK
jgi:hypothetical protein